MNQEKNEFVSHIGKRPAINQFDESIIHYKADRLKSALKCINQHIKSNKYDIQAHYMKTHILECMGKWHEAILCIEQVWNEENAKPEIMLLRALQYMHVGNVEKSLEFIDKAERSDGFVGDVYRCRARVMFELTIKKLTNQLDESIKWIQEACKIDPHNAYNHNEAANILFTKFAMEKSTGAEMLEKSIRHGKIAIGLGDKHVRTHYNLGRASFHARDMDSAIMYFEKTSKIDKNFANAYAMTALAMMQKEDRKYPSYRASVMTLYDKALKKDAKLPFVLQAKARLQLGEYDFKGAQTTLKVLSRIEPNNGQAWVCLAMTYVFEWYVRYHVDDVKIDRAFECLSRAPKNTKYADLEYEDLVKIAYGNSENDIMRTLKRYAILDHRYDTGIMLII